jgi:hypothetical protein
MTYLKQTVESETKGSTTWCVVVYKVTNFENEFDQACKFETTSDFFRCLSEGFNVLSPLVNECDNTRTGFKSIFFGSKASLNENACRSCGSCGILLSYETSITKNYFIVLQEQSVQRYPIG